MSKQRPTGSILAAHAPYWYLTCCISQVPSFNAAPTFVYDAQNNTDSPQVSSRSSVGHDPCIGVETHGVMHHARRQKRKPFRRRPGGTARPDCWPVHSALKSTFLSIAKRKCAFLVLGAPIG